MTTRSGSLGIDWAGLRSRLALRPFVLGTVGLVSVLVAWQVAVDNGILAEVTVSRPLTVLEAAWTLIWDDRFQPEMIDTVRTWALAMLLMAAVVVPIGIAVGYFRTLSDSVSSAMHVFRSVPSTALLPVFIILLGLGGSMKLAVVAYAITWPLMLNTIYGVRHVDPTMLTVGRSFGWGRRKLITRVIIPAASPYIATGIRIAGGIALIVVFSAELLGASRGIGTEMIRYSSAELPEFVMASIVIVGALGIILNTMLVVVEKRMLRWLPPKGE